MKALVPSAPFASLRKEMDRLFDRFWEGDFTELANLGEWTPRLDLSETKDAILARIEIPGILPEDIHVTIEDDVLTVRGEKKSEKEDKDEHFYRMERSYGSFARSIRLPVHVDPAKVQATFKNGLLLVAMPKAVSVKGTEIPIRTAV